MSDDIPSGVTHLGSDVYEIDTRMSGYRGITAGYLILGSRPCLVETGTATSAPVVREALAGLGVGPHDLATIVVTHIHLDHAGGVGDLAASYPKAEVVVHERGARHLVDPERLMRSSRRVFGDHVIDHVFGPLLPTGAERVRALGDTGPIDLGDGRMLQAYYSPGHAQHHIGLVDSATGDLYVGDAAGVYVPETADIRPATPPPDFDLDVALASLERFRALAPTRLLFSHYGPVSQVAETLERSGEELVRWVEMVREARRTGPDIDHAVELVRKRMRERQPAFEADPEVREKFEALSPTTANVTGISRWLDQKTPEI